MKRVKVGTYEAGWMRYELWLRPGTGGHGNLCPDGSKLAFIEIGADYQFWGQIIGTLLHEIFEATLMTMRCRYFQTNEMAFDTSKTFFHFDHAQYTEACDRAGEYMGCCMFDLRKAWLKWDRDQRAEDKQAKERAKKKKGKA